MSKSWDEVAWLELTKDDMTQVYELSRRGKDIRIRCGQKGKNFSENWVQKTSNKLAKKYFNDQKDKRLKMKYELVEKENRSHLLSPKFESKDTNPSSSTFRFSYRQEHEKDQTDAQSPSQNRKGKKAKKNKKKEATKANGDESEHMQDTDATHETLETDEYDDDDDATATADSGSGVDDSEDHDDDDEGSEYETGSDGTGQGDGDEVDEGDDGDEADADGEGDSALESSVSPPRPRVLFGKKGKKNRGVSGGHGATEDTEGDVKVESVETATESAERPQRRRARRQEHVFDPEAVDSTAGEAGGDLNAHKRKHGHQQHRPRPRRQSSNDGKEIEMHTASTHASHEKSESDASFSDRTHSSSSSGRSSDHNYEMDYEKMAKIMKDTVDAVVENPEWKTLKLWIHADETVERNVAFYYVPMKTSIAGSCHKIHIIRIKSSDGKEVTRLLKLARDPAEDNKHHFETERKVNQYLTRIVKCVNKVYHTRTDVCFWPVETVFLEYEGQMKFATSQPPFLAENNYVFVKVEPNSGEPCVNDPVVGRYQHVFSAITCGLDLVRDWQGYGISHEEFLRQTEKYCPEAPSQVRKRKDTKNTQVLVVIDPVLTKCTAHFETNNPTDFGVKAIDEWLSHHDCEHCRCEYFHLEPEIQFGFSDPGQKFFKGDIPPVIMNEITACRQEIGIWCGDDDFDPMTF